MTIISLINLVSAHTGNDAVDHSFKMADGIIGIIFIIIIIGGFYLFKRYKKKR